MQSNTVDSCLVRLPFPSVHVAFQRVDTSFRAHNSVVSPNQAFFRSRFYFSKKKNTNYIYFMCNSLLFLFLCVACTKLRFFCSLCCSFVKVWTTCDSCCFFICTAPKRCWYKTLKIHRHYALTNTCDNTVLFSHFSAIFFLSFVAWLLTDVCTSMELRKDDTSSVWLCRWKWNSTLVRIGKQFPFFFFFFSNNDITQFS